MCRVCGLEKRERGEAGKGLSAGDEAASWRELNTRMGRKGYVLRYREVFFCLSIATGYLI